MFNRNDPAMPLTEFEVGGTCKEYYGFTKFEEAALRFTAEVMLASMQRISDTRKAISYAVEIGILTAEEFCRQMEEREK